MKHIHFIALAMLLANASAMAQQKTHDRFQPRKKDIGLTLSLPYLNTITYHKYLTGKSASATGFIGFGAALFYRQNNVKFSLNVTAMMTNPNPIGPGGFGKKELRHNIHNTGIDAMVHYPLHRYFNIIGGINYMKMQHNRVGDGSTIRDFDKTDPSYGITTGIEAKLQRQFNLGLYYRPAVIGIGEKFYRHVISIDARFDFTVWRSRKLSNR